MEYALYRKTGEEGYYKKADRFGDCVRSFIRPRNHYVYSATVQMLVSSKSWYLIYSYGPWPMLNAHKASCHHSMH